MLAVDDTDPSAGQVPLPRQEKTPYQKVVDELTIAVAAASYRKFQAQRLYGLSAPGAVSVHMGGQEIG